MSPCDDKCEGTPDEVQVWKISQDLLKRARNKEELDWREIHQAKVSLEAALTYERPR